MLKICLVFWESEPQYAYKRYAYKKTTCSCTAVFKLHAAETMQNIAFAFFTLHVAYNLSSF